MFRPHLIDHVVSLSSARRLVCAAVVAGLVSACGGSDDGSGTVASAATSPPSSNSPSSAPAPLAPQATSATVPASADLPALAEDKPYSDATAYDTSASGSLSTAIEGAAVTHHRLKLGDQVFTYTATAGHLIIRDPNTNAPRATIFYTAYTQDNSDLKKRPLTVFFNGGPGSSSSFLHMGSYAPKRVFTSQGTKVTGPQDVTFGENPQSLLDKTDMIFVDPVGTGLSEAISPNKNSDFWGVNADVDSVAAFIHRYVIVNNRGSSPLMVYGESYGGPRAGILSYALHDQYGIKLSGLAMQAPALNFYEHFEYPNSTGNWNIARRYPLPPFLLPAYALALQYHGKLVDPSVTNLSPDQLFEKAENVLFDKENSNKFANVALPYDNRLAIVQEISDCAENNSSCSALKPLLSGPSASNVMSNVVNAATPILENKKKSVYVSVESLSDTHILFDEFATDIYANYVANTQSDALNLAPQVAPLLGYMATDTKKITPKYIRAIANGGLGSQIIGGDTTKLVIGSTVGSYDTRKLLNGTLPNIIKNYLTYDPSLDDLAVYGPIFESYLFNDLKYQGVSSYTGLNQAIQPAWINETIYPDQSKLPFPDATNFIAAEMLINPSMQVRTAAGFYDGVVPAAQVDWDMQSVAQQVPKDQMDKMYGRILYPGGHMGYADDSSRQILHDAFEKFYAQATTTSIPSLSR